MILKEFMKEITRKMNKEDRITYEEFMTMFKDAPRIAYTLYDKAEDEIKRLNNVINKAVEYIKKDTRWFDSNYVNIYGELCNCEGTRGDRLEVMVNPSNLLNILNGGKDE